MEILTRPEIMHPALKGQQITARSETPGTLSSMSSALKEPKVNPIHNAPRNPHDTVSIIGEIHLETKFFDGVPVGW